MIVRCVLRTLSVHWARPTARHVLGSPSGLLQTHKQGPRGQFLHHQIPRVNAPEKDQSRNNKREIDNVLNSITG